MMIYVIASIRVKHGELPGFLAIFNANIPSVREEQGCIEYVPAVDFNSGLPVQNLDKNTVTIIEKWESMDALRAHLRSPHMLAYREKVRNLVEDVSLKVLQEAQPGQKADPGETDSVG